mgnify:CR=1 FL=1
MISGFPEVWDTRAFGRALDTAFNGIVATWGEPLEQLFLPLLRVINGLEKLLQLSPWWAVVVAFCIVTWAAARQWRPGR